MAFRFDYDKEDDVLYICDALKKVKESVEFSEDIVLDLDNVGIVIGVELFYASDFFDLFNKEIDKEFLINLQDAGLEYKDYRNVWYVLLVLKSRGKQITQALPPLRKSEYVSPLIASCE